MDSGDYQVDITLLCYNHEKYLNKCLDSVIAQKTNFKFRLFIGDDCSTDGSRNIIEQYAEKYPDIIFPVFNEVNLGASKNSLNLKQYCTSRYLVGGESDDFWVDDHKLQKQYDFLEAHPEYVAVGSNYYNVDPDGENPYKSLLPWQVEKKYTMKDFLRYGFVIHGNTIMFRNVLPYRDERYKELRSKIPTMGDVMTRILLYDKGDFYCMKDIMHAHRIGSRDKDSFYTKNKSDPLKYCYMYNDIVNALTEYLSGKYDLSSLISRRMGSILFWKIMGITNFDKKEFKKYMSGLSKKIQIMSYVKAVQQCFRSAFHTVGRKLGL
ncbi:MAG: glycosyltransferase [Clostridia bacterium]|nr:glycosyltransferase [Clostridia bacterium]